MRDVTERNRLQAAEHHGQKMEAIGRLVSGVAHDFNNILQSISASLELVQDDLVVGSQAHNYSEVALRAAKRGSYLTHHLLSYARKQLLRPRLIDLPRLLSDTEALLGRTLGPHIIVSVRADVKAKTVLADPGQIQTALLNLAINASHAMPSGGSLVIESRALTKDGQGAVCISVTDSGTGMDEQTLARAVEPFFTTKGLNGTGLGLSMVQGFVEQSGGRMHINSVLGQGTVVELYLPADSASEPTKITQPDRIMQDRCCILLVDDDSDVLVTTGAFLEKAGFATLRAPSADRALAILASGVRIDALVTDYAMPGMNGADLITEAQLTRPNFPAVIISGFTELTNASSLGESIVTIHKPFQRDALITILRRLLGTECDVNLAQPMQG
jgi:CheY-like chemotaxis protein/anti-sigma regulatory factor (Ser/Thr protein kinase)